MAAIIKQPCDVSAGHVLALVLRAPSLCICADSVADKSLSVSAKLETRRETMEQLYRVQQLLKKLQVRPYADLCAHAAHTNSLVLVRWSGSEDCEKRTRAGLVLLGQMGAVIA